MMNDADPRLFASLAAALPSVDIEQRWAGDDGGGGVNFFSAILQESGVRSPAAAEPSKIAPQVATSLDGMTRGASPEDARSGRKRQRRTAKSCLACIQSHLSCDRSRPTCVNCFRRGRVCMYSDSAANSGAAAAAPPAYPVSLQEPDAKPDFDAKLGGFLAQQQQESALVQQLKQLVVQQQATLTQQNIFIQNMMAMYGSQPSAAAPPPPPPPPPPASHFQHTFYSSPSSSSSSQPPPASPFPLPSSSQPTTSATSDALPEWKRNPFAQKLLALQCFAKQSWAHQPERSRDITRQLHKSFIENNPDAVMLSVEMDEKGAPRLLGATQAYLAVLRQEGLSSEPEHIMHRLLTGHESIFCTSARSAQINFILPCTYFNPSGCHRLVYEKSNQFMYNGQLRSGEFWLSMFYDHEDRMAGVLGVTQLHDTLMPVTKAYLVTDSCSRCSKLPQLPPGIQVPAFRSPDPYSLDQKDRLTIEQIRHSTAQCACPPSFCTCQPPSVQSLVSPTPPRSAAHHPSLSDDDEPFYSLLDSRFHKAASTATATPTPPAKHSDNSTTY